MNLIPAIDLIGGQCVRLYKGRFNEQTIYDVDPVLLAREYESLGFKNLHIVDLDGARSGRQGNEKIIRRIVNERDLRIQVGGGVRTEEQIEHWLDAGLARVVIGSLAVTEPTRVAGWLAKYGPEKIVLALDVTMDNEGVPLVATHAWTRSGDMTLWQCLELYSPAGLQHVICTDISRDGAMTGPNLELYSRLIERYPDIVLQASGGIRGMGDLKVLKDIGAPAAISGRALLDSKIKPGEIATFLRAA
jgi:phosphoribosylformimino-5-aminoimidazole carboxamide ribotide isomerase